MPGSEPPKIARLDLSGLASSHTTNDAKTQQKPLFYAPIDSVRGCGPAMEYTVPSDALPLPPHNTKPHLHAPFQSSMMNNRPHHLFDAPRFDDNLYNQAPRRQYSNTRRPQQQEQHQQLYHHPQQQQQQHQQRHNTNNAPMDHKIFVGGLNYTTTDQELYEFFESRFGTVVEAHIVKNRERQSRGFGFVVFKDQESCRKAVQSDHTICYGARVDIRRAQVQNSSPSSSGNHKKGINPDAPEFKPSYQLSIDVVHDMSSSQPTYPFDIGQLSGAPSTTPEVVSQIPADAQLVGAVRIKNQATPCEAFQFFD